MPPQGPLAKLLPAHFKPQCTHLTVTRLYGFEFLCENCSRPGPFGWVYCCTQDREVMIESAMAAGSPQYFDDLGEYWSSKARVRPRTGTAEARADPLSFFDEITPQQISHYRPEQIQTILRQRESVRNTVSKEKFNQSFMAGNPILSYLETIPRGLENPRPWVPSLEHECRYMVCPSCRPGVADRSFLSLDSIAKGEVPPTSAVGYGFHRMGDRPVVDIGILKSIGSRPASLIKSYRDESFDSSLPDSDISLIELLERQIYRSQQPPASVELGCGSTVGYRGGISHGRVTEVLPKTLKHSPGCDNLSAVFIKATGETRTPQKRPPWTPPPSPSPYGKSNASETFSLGFAAESSITDGRSPLSLKTNQITRQQLLNSIRLISSQEYISDLADSFMGEEWCETENERNTGPNLHCNGTAFELACKAPLQMQSLTEQIHLCESESLTASSGGSESSSTTDYGAAVSEESAELGLPGIIAQA